MNLELTLEAAERVLKGVNIPPRPTLLTAIDEELKRNDPSLAKIATLVSKDVGIAATMLKTVNSPLFGLRSKVGNPLQAVQMLGVKNVRNIVTGLVLRAAMGSKAMSLENFWESSEKVAELSVFLCKLVPRPPRDEAYIFGLFHDCGIPLLMQRFPDYEETLKMAANADRSLAIIENERHETNHTVLGYMVAKSWGLPTDVCDAILRHHDPSVFDHTDRDKPLIPTLVAINCLAEHINNSIVSPSDSQKHDGIVDKALDYLGLSWDEYGDFRDDAMALFN